MNRNDARYVAGPMESELPSMENIVDNIGQQDWEYRVIWDEANNTSRVVRKPVFTQVKPFWGRYQSSDEAWDKFMESVNEKILEKEAVEDNTWEEYKE